MRKEILFAILAGIAFGVIVAFGIWRANTALKPQEPPTNQEQTQTQEAGNLNLTISKPENLEVMTESTATIEGLTSPNLLVVVSGEEEDYIIESDDSGKFTEEVDLIGGINKIRTSVFDDEMIPTESSVTLIYSSAFANQLNE